MGAPAAPAPAPGLASSGWVISHDATTWPPRQRLKSQEVFEVGSASARISRLVEGGPQQAYHWAGPGQSGWSGSAASAAGARTTPTTACFPAQPAPGPHQPPIPPGMERASGPARSRGCATFALISMPAGPPARPSTGRAGTKALGLNGSVEAVRGAQLAARLTAATIPTICWRCCDTLGWPIFAIWPALWQSRIS